MLRLLHSPCHYAKLLSFLSTTCMKEGPSLSGGIQTVLLHASFLDGEIRLQEAVPIFEPLVTVHVGDLISHLSEFRTEHDIPLSYKNNFFILAIKYTVIVVKGHQYLDCSLSNKKQSL